jgi:hypothetical protein
MRRRTVAQVTLAVLAVVAIAGEGGCVQHQSVAAGGPVSRMQNVPAPVDDQGREMGPMPLAVGDNVGRSVYMTRPALVARGLVPTDSAFADGSMSDPGEYPTGE